VGEAQSPVRPLPTAALCLSRFDLDALLALHFRELGGELRERERWRENGPGEGVVWANGRRPHPREGSWRWFGLKVHARNVASVADLEMHGSANGYVGITRLREGEVNVCGLFRRSAATDGARPSPFAATPAQGKGCEIISPLSTPHAVGTEDGRAPLRAELLRGEPGTPLRARLAAAVFDEASFCSVAGLSLRPQRAADHTQCCIGDALTMIPPVTGNGMSMAFESAELAIEPLAAYARGEIAWTHAQRAVARACDEAFGKRLRWARWLQWMMFAPVLQYGMARVALNSEMLWRVMFAKTR
jgi:2-polyprenyl-6-methoxyphenol hydroxylase-like FAD-dependent oxidoreductase